MPLWLDNQLERYFPIGSVATFSSFQQGAFVTLPACVLRLNILLAKEIAAESNSQDEIVERIARDDYMKYAVKEVYHTLKLVLTETLEAEGRMWVERIYEDIDTSIMNRKIHHNFQLNKLSLVITRVTALLGIPRHIHHSRASQGDLPERHHKVALNPERTPERPTYVTRLFITLEAKKIGLERPLRATT
ncbi:hypothetical protein F2Q70_00009706 [Brassica cretica]|uniref:Callose synthase helical domain-containing protein n=1 Tax=Brassica cretica TaxID=69181 RepID=A0A8S9M469_BRACR|nr:hypothetical protein F2Q70_00009706 [Brassica cretica]